MGSTICYEVMYCGDWLGVGCGSSIRREKALRLMDEYGSSLFRLFDGQRTFDYTRREIASMAPGTLIDLVVS